MDYSRPTSRPWNVVKGLVCSGVSFPLTFKLGEIVPVCQTSKGYSSRRGQDSEGQ